MTNSFNPLDPMNHSMYHEYEYPGTIEEVVKYYDNMPNPNGPKLRPQVSKDSWYYSKDYADDGKISPFEKLKAFVKGGTYNMVRGLFCDKDGFSLARTLTTAITGTAIYLAGPVGLAIAGGFGLLAAVDNFAQSAKLAKNAVSDQQAREAYEGFGESTTTAGLSLFGGYKGFQAIKNNFAWLKSHPNMRASFFDRFTKWNISRHATLKPTKPKAEPKAEPKPPVAETPIAEEPPTPFVPEREPIITEPKEPITTTPRYYNTPDMPRGGAGSPIEFEGNYFPETTPTQVYPHTGVNAKPVEYFSESTPHGNITQTSKPTPKVAETEYFSESNPTGNIPKKAEPNYFSETDPTGNIPPKTQPDIEWYGF